MGAPREHLENCSSDWVAFKERCQFHLARLCREDDQASAWSDPLHTRIGLIGQATQGGWRMPWGQEPMKGVAHDVTLRGGASSLRSGDARMGKPDAGDAASLGSIPRGNRGN